MNTLKVSTDVVEALFNRAGDRESAEAVGRAWLAWEADVLVDTGRWEEHRTLMLRRIDHNGDETYWAFNYVTPTRAQALREFDEYEERPDELELCQVEKVPVTTYEYQAVTS